jgi:hypothetical protein
LFAWISVLGGLWTAALLLIRSCGVFVRFFVAPPARLTAGSGELAGVGRR